MLELIARIPSPTSLDFRFRLPSLVRRHPSERSSSVLSSSWSPLSPPFPLPPHEDAADGHVLRRLSIAASRPSLLNHPTHHTSSRCKAVVPVASQLHCRCHAGWCGTQYKACASASAKLHRTTRSIKPQQQEYALTNNLQHMSPSICIGWALPASAVRAKSQPQPSPKHQPVAARSLSL